MIEKLKQLLGGYAGDVALNKLKGSGGRGLITVALTAMVWPKLEIFGRLFWGTLYPQMQVIFNAIGIENFTLSFHVNKLVLIGTASLIIHLLVSGGHDALGLALQNIKAGKPVEPPPAAPA